LTTHTHTLIHTYTHAQTETHSYTHTHTHTHTHMHRQRHTHTLIHTHTHTHTHTHQSFHGLIHISLPTGSRSVSLRAGIRSFGQGQICHSKPSLCLPPRHPHT